MGYHFSPPEESFQPRDWIHVSCISWLAGRFFATSATWEAYSFLWLPCERNELLSQTAKSLQSCLTLCDPIDSSPPDFPVPGILQARTLEWVAISFSNAWKWKVKVKSFANCEVYPKLPILKAQLVCPSSHWHLPWQYQASPAHYSPWLFLNIAFNVALY